MWSTRKLIQSAAVMSFALIGGSALLPSAPAASADVATQHPRKTRLAAVSVVSENDVWVVGSRVKTSGTNPVALHWDGQDWTKALLPGLGNRGYSRLAAVDAIGTDDVWAVGTAPNTWQGAPLALHFDGTSWTRAPKILFKGVTGSLNAVADHGSSDVWMTGRLSTGATLSVHWDGEKLTRVETGDPPLGPNLFLGTCMTDQGRAIAVGSQVMAEGPGGRDPARVLRVRPLVEEWDGSTWSVEQDAVLGKHPYAFEAVTCPTDDDVWAVGRAMAPPAAPLALVEHRTADGWTQVTAAEQWKADLAGVVTVAPDDVWAVGYRASHQGSAYPWVEHGVGETWTGGTVPYKYDGAKLTGVDADAADDVWVVGNEGIDGQIIVARWDGSTWTPMK